MNDHLLEVIKEIVDDRSVEILSKMGAIALTVSVNEASAAMKKGAVLLGIRECYFDDFDHHYFLLLGWPRKLGEQPDVFRDLSV